MNGKLLLTILILAGLIVGAVLGAVLYDPNWNTTKPDSAHHYADILVLFHFLGFTIFMGLLKMLIIPLIAVSVVVAVTSVGDIRKLGRMGGWTLVYYFATMGLAVCLGLLCVTIIQPGAGIGAAQELPTAQGLPAQQEIVDQAAGGLAGVFENLITMMIPENIFQAMASGQTLPVIVFAIFFGVVVTMIGERARRIVELFEALFEVFMRMVELVLWLAPVGVFALLAWTIARIGLGVFTESIGVYMLTVLLGLFVHGLIVLPLILWLFTRENPFRFLHQMRQALMTAIGTDSSTATLPVTIDCATNQGGVSKRAAGLVLPLGSTINMDGTALYEAVAVVFMAQAFNIELGAGQMLLIAVTATLAAVGAAGIPSAGLVTMVIVLDATNQSLIASNPAAELIPVAAIGLIIGVDRILDMFRTAVNVWGDAVGAKIITLLDEDDYI